MATKEGDFLLSAEYCQNNPEISRKKEKLFLFHWGKERNDV
ncbi:MULTISPECIES: hypothetical protein [Citrobacter]|nr:MULTISPECIES: hypothetical protein [Citrobacter]MDL4619424.1 hypothetical protein [Citrobacter amalonaticus]MDL4623522.1 hypothetical protein [Citrobacter amalonaticus]MDT7076276.1 hypothetical protein [Citrobacter amalonaticus]MEC5724952.1 hypothetical protein [Citrobacter amalonaticus]